jgi:hypothetical protein
MNEKFGFEEKMKELKMKSVSDFAKLFDDFQFTSSGNIRNKRTRPEISIPVRRPE